MIIIISKINLCIFYRKISAIVVLLLLEVNIASSQCPSNVIDYDGNIYGVVQIGKQCWMDRDLSVTHRPNGISLMDGSGIGSATNGGNWANSTYFFNYNDSVQYVNDYGRLYTWYAAMNSATSSNTYPSGVQGICPNGWHLPSIAEWDTLIYALDTISNFSLSPGFSILASTTSGGLLKDTSLNFWNSPNVGATNTTFFNSRGGGFRDPSGFFNGNNIQAIYLSTTEWSQYKMYTIIIENTSSNLYVYGNTNKVTGHSVRCVCDQLATTVQQIESKNKTNVFPNPTNDELNIQVDNTVVGSTYQLTDITGRPIKTGIITDEKSRISLQGLSSGTYLLSIGDEIRKTLKVVKD